MKKTTLVAFCMALAAITNAGELMTERCSGMVAIVPSYDDMPNTSGTVILRRGTNGFSGWRHLTVKLNPDGYIRWWCQPEVERMDEGAIPLWEPVNQNPCAAWSMARASD